MALTMADTHKSFTDGTHRTVSPAETLAKVTPHLAAMGITRVANVTGLDRIGVPVFNAYRPNSRSLAVSQGKGLSEEAAKASAVMEAVEGFHAEEVDLPLYEGSFAQMAKEARIIALEHLAFLSGTTFRPHRPVLWIEGQDLFSGEAVLLPSELVHTDYTLPKQPTAGCFVASTNGLASGNHPLEAILHAIYEVVERDAHTLWEVSPFAARAASRVDLDSITDTACCWVLDRLRAAELSVGVWDMTTDVGLATFHCMITDEREPGGHSGGGAGTHLSRDVALLRALTEAVQVRTNYITGARDDLRHEEYEAKGIALKTDYIKALMAVDVPEPIRFEAVPTQICDTLEEDLHHTLSRLDAVGVPEVIEVALTKPGFDIPVHRVVIPGLEGPHDHREYAPGRRARRLLRRPRR